MVLVDRKSCRRKRLFTVFSSSSLLGSVTCGESKKGGGRIYLAKARKVLDLSVLAFKIAIQFLPIRGFMGLLLICTSF